MSFYQELRTYSPALDCEILRVSMTDGRGAEFWMTVRDPGSAKALRTAKQQALAAIEEAITLGLAPGEVVLICNSR